MARRRKVKPMTFDLNTIEGTVVDHPVTWRQRSSSVAQAVRDLVSQSYHDNTPIEVPVPYSGENTIKRDGTDTGVDKNINALLSALRRAARQNGWGVKSSVTHAPDEGMCYVTFQVGELTRRKPSEDVAHDVEHVE